MAMDWDSYFMNEAYMAASKSKDRSTQVGACIVGPDNSIRSKGYNGPCRGEDDTNDDLFIRPGKDYATEHAERNAIYNCARNGIATLGCRIYLTWVPCSACARAIKQSGIVEVIAHRKTMAEKWRVDMAESASLLHRTGVAMRFWHGSIVVPPTLFNGIRESYT